MPSTPETLDELTRNDWPSCPICHFLSRQTPLWDLRANGAAALFSSEEPAPDSRWETPQPHVCVLRGVWGCLPSSVGRDPCWGARTKVSLLASQPQGAFRLLLSHIRPFFLGHSFSELLMVRTCQQAASTLSFVAVVPSFVCFFLLFRQRPEIPYLSKPTSDAPSSLKPSLLGFDVI